MQAVDDMKTLGRARLSFANEGEIDLFVETLGKFERGEITPDAWRVFRLVQGLYGQRQEDVQMLRAKVPQGVLTVPQLHALADVADRHARGFAHITTRQNVQLHFVKIGEVETVMRHLAAQGLTTREACGSTVRNITTCPWAGVAHDEAFDVTPYAEALTRHLLRHPKSGTLPRKLKIAFEGCTDDHNVTLINDLGFRALVLSGVRGFRVTVGGGTGILPTVARELFSFLPAGEILDVAEALVGVFHRLGDREHRNRNRLKFLVEELGFDAFRDELWRELAIVRAAGGTPLPFHPEAPPEDMPPAPWDRTPAGTGPYLVGHASARRGDDGGELDRLTLAETARAATSNLRGPGLLPTVPARNGDLGAFRSTNVRPQRQPGFSTVVVRLPLGDVTAPQLRLLGDLALAYADGTARLTIAQNLVIRWVRTDEIPELYERLAAGALGGPGAGTIADATSCPGAESCKLAVTQSRGLARSLEEHLTARPRLAALAPNLNLKASGCPNGCGQHHIAGIGFQGSVRRVGGKAVPQYFVMTGGEIEEGTVHFARTVSRVPARRVPDAVERLLRLYGSEGAPGESAPAFFRRIGAARQKELLLDLERLSPEEARPDDFVDLGQDAETTFTVEATAGECAR